MTDTDELYPRRFGRYVLVDLLAKGGMGELHLAITSGGSGIQKLCVIKQLLGQLDDKEHVQRFVDEANVMANLSHGNLVPVLESGAIDGQYFLAMEYVEGKNLRELWNTLAENGRILPLNLALHIVKEVCRGLGFAHSAGDLGLVHRDVSPPNILLSYSGEVRLTDFGLALSSLKVQRTSPGILLGKLPYMSPEQARGEKLDVRSDLYALGVILWELITGQRRIDPETTQLEQLQFATNPKLIAPTTIRSDLPPRLDLIARRVLAPGREERFADAEALRQEIAKILANVDPTTDAPALQSFLATTYGDDIARERRELERRLSGMAEQVDLLLAEEKRDGLPDVLADLASESAPTRKRRDPTTEILPGVTLDDKYLIQEMIGQGGMGKVYKATHLGIERTVALKILLPEYRSIASVVDRFQMEARAANRVGHPNVVEIFDSGTTQAGLLYYAMEYLQGTDLADLLYDERTLEVSQTLRIGMQICAAIEAAHDAGVIHRDLKPENIYLIVKEGEPNFVKVVDFGIARIEGGRSHTLPGLAVGTPEYMAPEQARSLPVDRRADVYALGVMLYEMLAGKVPRPDDGSEELPPVTPLRELREDVPAELEQIVLSTLDPDPEKRPGSMGHLSYELRRLLKGRAAAVASVLNISGAMPSMGGPIEDPGEFDPIMLTARVKPVAPRPAIWRWLPYAMTGVALILTVVAAVLFLSHEKRSEARSSLTTPTAGTDQGVRGPATGATEAARPSMNDASPVTGAKAKRRPRRRRPHGQRKPQRKAVRLEGTLDPFSK